MKKRIRVLLCGTVFGQIYLRGVLKNSAYELKGILSTGSSQSRALAKEHNIRLHTDIKEISAEEYDLALVVIRSGIVGGKGNQVALELLQKGISVVQEQPVHADEAIMFYKMAIEKKVYYSVNTFYKTLPASIVFQNKAKELKRKEKIGCMDGACSMPVLLPFLDQICRIIGGVHPYHIDIKKSMRIRTKAVITVDICGVECLLRINDSLNKYDIENNAYLLNACNVMYKSGNLMLTEVNGQVVFVPRPYVVEEYMKQETVDSERDCNGSEILYDVSGKRFGELYKDEWPDAVHYLLEQEEENIREKKCDVSTMQYYIGLCSLWKDISDCMSQL